MELKLTTLNATTRTLGAARNNGRMRKAGSIPAVYYGKGQEAVSVTVDDVELRSVLAPGKRYTLLDLTIDGKGGNPAVVYDYQKDNLTQKITHVDFLKIDSETPVKVRIPVRLNGVPSGVKNQGGVLSQENRYIKLAVKPAEIPASFDLDISEIGAGITYYAKALPLGNAQLVSPAQTVIFTISKAKIVKEEKAAETKGKKGKK
jgi:large subunit ribosomal protein L25